MPELPEVEIVKEGLRKVIKPGVTIEKIQFRRKDLRSPLPTRLKNRIIHQKILDIQRRAKYILFDFENVVMISHLGMTGTWRVVAMDQQLGLHDHVVLTLSNGKVLAYNDPRRFGVFDIIPKPGFSADKRFCHLGPEPFSETFDVEYFWQRSRKKVTAIKTFIMDQRFVVGVGNIYASEALYRAGVSPLLTAGNINREQITLLIGAIQQVLKQSIDAGGSSISDYRGVDEVSGSFQDKFLVYGRAGEPCHKCSRAIRAKVISGRSTFWCVNCQKTSRKKITEQKNYGHTRKNLSSTSGT